MDKQKPRHLAMMLASLTLLALLLGAWTMGQPAKRTESSVAQSLMDRTPSLRTDMALQVDSTEPTTETVPLDNAKMGQMMEESAGMMDSSMPMTSSMMMESMGGDAEMRQMMQMMGMMMSCMKMMESDMGMMDSSMPMTDTMPMTGSMMMESMGGDAEMRQMMQMMGMMMNCMKMMESGMGAMDSSMSITSTMPITVTTPSESSDGSEDLEDSR